MKNEIKNSCWTEWISFSYCSISFITELTPSSSSPMITQWFIFTSSDGILLNFSIETSENDLFIPGQTRSYGLYEIQLWYNVHLRIGSICILLSRLWHESFKRFEDRNLTSMNSSVKIPVESLQTNNTYNQFLVEMINRHDSTRSNWKYPIFNSYDQVRWIFSRDSSSFLVYVCKRFSSLDEICSSIWINRFDKRKCLLIIDVRVNPWGPNHFFGKVLFYRIFRAE